MSVAGIAVNKFKEMKQWLASLDSAIHQVPVDRAGAAADRWLLVYNKESDTSAAEVLPLQPLR